MQLWVALPDAHREVAPDFAPRGDLPLHGDGAAAVRVLVGEVDGARSSARAYTPLVGAEIALDGAGRATLPLEPEVEHAVLAPDGTVDVDGVPLGPVALPGHWSFRADAGSAASRAVAAAGR